jgi:hypothetical protein
MISVFKATRQELWSAITKAGLTEGLTWKTTSREEMMAIAVRGNINQVEQITAESALLKKVSKVFTPAFFTTMRELEAAINGAVATEAVLAETVEDVGEEPETDEPEPSQAAKVLAAATATSVKKN